MWLLIINVRKKEWVINYQTHTTYNITNKNLSEGLSISGCGAQSFHLYRNWRVEECRGTGRVGNQPP